MKPILPILFILITLFSCNQITKPVVVDNSSDKDLLIVLDSKDTIKLKKNEKNEVPIQFGNRKISVNGEELGEIKLESNNEYILNPTKSNYYKKTILFFSSGEAQKNHEKYSHDTIMINGIEFEGEYEKYIDFTNYLEKSIC